MILNRGKLAKQIPEPQRWCTENRSSVMRLPQNRRTNFKGRYQRELWNWLEGYGKKHNWMLWFDPDEGSPIHVRSCYSSRGPKPAFLPFPSRLQWKRLEALLFMLVYSAAVSFENCLFIKFILICPLADAYRFPGNWMDVRAGAAKVSFHSCFSVSFC